MPRYVGSPALEGQFSLATLAAQLLLDDRMPLYVAAQRFISIVRQLLARKRWVKMLAAQLVLDVVCLAKMAAQRLSASVVSLRRLPSSCRRCMIFYNSSPALEG